MSKNPKIKGIIFQHDDNDYSVKFLKTLLAVFGDNGCSVRGTKKDILDTIRENT